MRYIAQPPLVTKPSKPIWFHKRISLARYLFQIVSLSCVIVVAVLLVFAIRCGGKQPRYFTTLFLVSCLTTRLPKGSE